MDRLKKARTPVRAAFTVTANKLSAELLVEVPDRGILEKTLEKLERLGRELENHDEKILEALLDVDAEEDVYAEEHRVIEEYRDKLLSIRFDILLVLKQDAEVFSSAKSASAAGSPSSKRKFKLPRLQLATFGGELKEWLGFWSQFKKIDEDDDIVPGDKFLYLIQATIKGSRARELVESFPATGENYPKVIASLKSRFGREDLLVEVYIRELLKLVISNSQKINNSIPKLYDQLESHLRALESIGVSSEKYSAILFPMVESCLPENTIRVWQRTSVQQGKPLDSSASASNNRLTDLMTFLQGEVEGEERILLAREGFTPKLSSGSKSKFKIADESTVPTAAGLFAGDASKNSSCVFCSKGHDSKDCFSAQKMPLKQKKSILSEKRCCFSCLKTSHISKNCKLSVKCLLCGKKHLILMCPDLPNNKEKPEEQKVMSASAENVQSALANYSSAQEVVLQTLMIKLTCNGKEKVVRALIDSGSQKSYILSNTAKEMGYASLGEVQIIHSLFGGVQSAQRKHQKYQIYLANLTGNYTCHFQALDQPAICGEIPRMKNGPWIGELKTQNIWLSDFGLGNPQIEVLIGADVCGKLMTGNVRQLKCGLVAVETTLGWTIMGKAPIERENSVQMVTTMFINEASISDLWNLDVIGIKDPIESKSKECLDFEAKEYFLKTVKTNEEGRYEVNLPWISGHAPLPSNRMLAEKRLINATRKLIENGDVEKYQGVFDVWKDLGIIEEVTLSERDLPVHYLPHRAVFNESSLTTPIRPVFDASAHEKNSPSLNDCLEKGPNLIELIPNLMMKFREKKIGIVGDITKAFLQISVAAKDRDFLRFLWWEDQDRKKIKIFRHRRVVFGVNCSPFLLGAVIEFHLGQAPTELKETAEKLLHSLYIDNCLTSVDKESEMIDFIRSAKQLMSSGGFNLTGWEHTLLNNSGCANVFTPVLGMIWNREKDTLKCDTGSLVKEVDNSVTKRVILSVAHKIFDPIGFTCPLTIFPKIILQQCWTLKLGWDAELPEDLVSKFLSWKKGLQLLAEMEVPRWFASPQPFQEKWSIHTFCDASKLAYAAVVFLRVESSEGVNIQLVQARARVSPLKKSTIPRLELLSCLIGSRLAASTKEGLGIEDTEISFWTDSTTALSWIQRSDSWGTFVWNRVQEIKSLTNLASWRYVPGAKNPADLPSRGCSAKQLLESRWWEGPEWLRKPAAEWPMSQGVCDEVEVNKEKKKTLVSTLTAGKKHPLWFMRYFSSYRSIVRLVGWVMRFVNNSRKENAKLSGHLSVMELEAAEVKILKIVQDEVFSDLKCNSLKSICALKDQNGLLRVKTKILLKEDYEDFKRPIVLPSNHPLVEAIIREEHLRNSHVAGQTLLSLLRERYWILQGRKSIRKTLSSCGRCQRYRSKKIESEPVHLPLDRVREAWTFEVTGVDLGGPLLLKCGTKAWFVLYTCAIYRAVHLELVTSLSTDGFLQSLRRFIARRGRPNIVYSDNGTNFVGSNNVFGQLDWESIQCYATASRIKWKFNPPTAAWWGGWWERIIGTTKQLLRRVLGRSRLTYEEMVTTLCDCEAIINARPLTYISENPSDLVPLSPSMFLQEVKESGVPDMDAVDATSLNRRIKYRQKLRNDLRQRFRKEYLGQLIQKKGKCTSDELRVGDIVIVGSDNTKRLDWPLAKVINIYPGKDGSVRVVRVKTSSGELVRPIQRIYPLEISSPADEAILNEQVKKTVFTRVGRQIIAPNRLTY